MSGMSSVIDGVWFVRIAVTDVMRDELRVGRGFKNDGVMTIRVEKGIDKRGIAHAGRRP